MTHRLCGQARRPAAQIVMITQPTLLSVNPQPTTNKIKWSPLNKTIQAWKTNKDKAHATECSENKDEATLAATKYGKLM